MDDSINPFPWIKENIVSSSAGGPSLHRQGICIVIRSRKVPILFHIFADLQHAQAGAFS